MRQRFLTVCAMLVLPAAAACAQFQPTVQPKADPAKPGQQAPPPGNAEPQAPGKPAPGGPPNEFPGPHGTKFTFPTSLYDEKAVATDQVRVARQKAQKEGKRVLIMWGENMCGFCVFLNDILVNDTVVAPLVKTDYVWIKINIGKFDRNTDLAEYYSTAILDKNTGAPALTIVDPASDKAVGVKGGNAMVAKPMTMDQPFDTTVIREFLIINRPPARVAQTVYNDSVAKAKGGGRLVLAAFTVPLSEQCEAMERFLASPEAAPVLAKGYEVVKIDTERMIGGRTVLNRLAEGKVVAAPFIAIATSDGELAAPGASFSGLPADSAEVQRFVGTLAKLSGKLDPKDEQVLSKALMDANAAGAEAKK